MFKANQKVQFTTPRGETYTGIIKGSYEQGDKTLYTIEADIDTKLNKFGIEPQFIKALGGTSRRETSLLKYRAKLEALDANRPTDPKGIRKWNSERKKIVEMIALREQQIAEAHAAPQGVQQVTVPEFEDVPENTPAALHTDNDPHTEPALDEFEL